MFASILDRIAITVNIITIKIGDFVFLTVIKIIQMIQCSTAFCSSPVSTLPDSSSIILSKSCDIVKTCIFRFILVGISCITGADNKNRFLIVGSAIMGMCGFSGIILTSYCLKPDMISPVIVTVRETDDYIVTIRIIRFTKNVFIQDGNDALNGTGTLVCCTRLQFCSDHHNKANCFTVISSGNLIILRPFRTDIFSIIGLHHKIVICTTSYRFTLNSFASNRGMSSLITMPGNQIIHCRSVTRIVCIIIPIALAAISIQIELKIIMNSVIVQIQNSITFRCNRYLLVLTTLC